MDCRQVRERLELYRMEGLSPGEQRDIQKHLEECVACSEEARELDEVLRAVRERPAPAAPAIPPGLRNLLRDEAATQRKTRAYQKFMRYAAAIAAVLLLAVTGIEYWQQEKPVTPHQAIVKKPVHAERESPEQPATSKPIRPVSRLLWQVNDTYSAHESLADTPVLIGSRMFVLKRDTFERTRVAAIDAETGAEIWTSSATRVRKIAADGSRVYGLETDSPSHSMVLGFDADSGDLLWRTKLETSTSPLACSLSTTAAGVVVLAGRQLYLLGGLQGEHRWTRVLPGKRCPAVATCSAGKVLVATSKDLLCVDSTNGTIAWTRIMEGKASRLARPCIVAQNECCYVGRPLRNGKWDLFCYQTQEAKQLWKRKAPEATTHIAADNEVVLVRGRRSRQALSANTGKQLWQHRAVGCGPMSLAGGIVYYVDMAGEGALVAREARTGKALWRERAVRSCSEVLIGGGLVYLNAHAGRLYAFRSAQRH